MFEHIGILWQNEEDGQATLQSIRRTYATNPQLSIARWFQTFDDALIQSDFAICQTLLKEMRDWDYGISEKERTYVDSREAALLLGQGIRAYNHGLYLQAEQYYLESQRLHQKLDHREGVGQTIAALEMLKLKTERDKEGKYFPWVDPVEVTIQPMALGDIDALLAERLEQMSMADQLQVIIAAKECGRLFPLLKALKANDSYIQSAAAAALSWLEPGPDYADLLQMLDSPNWIVCWQATVMLRKRAHKEQTMFTHYMIPVMERVSRQLGEKKLHPLVRQEMIQLLYQRVLIYNEVPDEAYKMLDYMDNSMQSSLAEPQNQPSSNISNPGVLKKLEMFFTLLLFGLACVVSTATPIALGFLLHSWWVFGGVLFVIIILFGLSAYFVRNVEKTKDWMLWTSGIPLGLAYLLAGWLIGYSIVLVIHIIFWAILLAITLSLVGLVIGYVASLGASLSLIGVDSIIPACLDILTILGISIVLAIMFQSWWVLGGSFQAMLIFATISAAVWDKDAKINVKIWAFVFTIPLGIAWGYASILLSHLIVSVVHLGIFTDPLPYALFIVAFLIGYIGHIFTLDKMNDFQQKLDSL